MKINKKYNNNVNNSTTRKTKNKKIASVILIILMFIWSLGSILSFYNACAESNTNQTLTASAEEVQQETLEENSSYIKFPLKMVEGAYFFNQTDNNLYSIYGYKDIYIVFPLNSASTSRQVTLLYEDSSTFVIPYAEDNSIVGDNFDNNTLGGLYLPFSNNRSDFLLNTIRYSGTPIAAMPSSAYLENGAFHFGSLNNQNIIIIDLFFRDIVTRELYPVYVSMYFDFYGYTYIAGQNSSSKIIEFDSSYVYGGGSGGNNEVYQQTIIQQQNTIDSLNSELNTIQGDFSQLYNDYLALRNSFDNAIAEREQAYNDGFLQGQLVGYNNGYVDGMEVSGTDSTFLGLMSAIVDAPIQALEGLLSFSVFGTDMTEFVFSLIAVAFIIAIIRIFI